MSAAASAETDETLSGTDKQAANKNGASTKAATESWKGSADNNTTAKGVTVTIEASAAKVKEALDVLLKSGADLGQLDRVKAKGQEVVVRMGSGKDGRKFDAENERMHTFPDERTFSADRVIIEANPDVDWSAHTVGEWASILGHEFVHAAQAAEGQMASRQLVEKWWTKAGRSYGQQVEAYERRTIGS